MGLIPKIPPVVPQLVLNDSEIESLLSKNGYNRHSEKTYVRQSHNWVVYDHFENKFSLCKDGRVEYIKGDITIDSVKQFFREQKMNDLLNG